jgi:hypothetical protein
MLLKMLYSVSFISINTTDRSIDTVPDFGCYLCARGDVEHFAYISLNNGDSFASVE